jgi:hypothetical protein
MKKLLAYAAALLLILESTAYAQGGGSGGAVGGAAGGAGAGMGATSDGSVDGSKSSTGPKAAQSDTSLPPAPNSITAGNRTGNNNSPLPGQPGNPQTGPIRR